MYPKNAASPQRVAIGPVVQISDGAVQTATVSVKVMPQGGAAAAGGGTIAYEEGIVHYLPTQAETNYASFMLIAYKTGCIPATCTVVTTISSTAGHAGLDWANIIAPTTTVGLSGTTVKTATDVETDTADIQTRLPAALVGGRIDASIGAAAANTITASALAADAVTEIQSGLALAADLATVAGYLDTEIAAILADTNELQTDWVNGGRLDLILDARASQTSVDIIDDFLDTEIAALTTAVADVPTVAEFEARTPTAAQLAYIVANAATGLPVTFTTSGGSTTAAVLNQVDGAAASATNDQYNGRLLVFTDGTLKGVVTDITDYVGGTTTATITAIPFAPTASHNARLI